MLRIHSRLFPFLAILICLVSLTLAQNTFPNFSPADIAPTGGRVGIVNRNVHEPDFQTNFWISGLRSATKYLEFKARVSGNGTDFLLVRWHGDAAVDLAAPLVWGKGDFNAQWGDKTVKCHLELNPAAVNVELANSKKFSFLPGGTTGSYLWPCWYQDWVQVVCNNAGGVAGQLQDESTCISAGW